MSDLVGKVTLLPEPARVLVQHCSNGYSVCSSWLKTVTHRPQWSQLEARQWRMYSCGSCRHRTTSDSPGGPVLRACEVDAVRLIKTTVKHFGRLDVLINNAGISDFDSIETTSLGGRQYDRTMSVASPSRRDAGFTFDLTTGRIIRYIL